MNPLILPALTLSALISGFFMGKFHERYEWNKLIEKGLIPAPQKNKKG